MADDPASAAAAASRSSSSSADDEEEEEGTDSDPSNNSDPAAPQDPPPLLPDSSAPPPAPAAASEPAAPIPTPPTHTQEASAAAAAAAAAAEDSRRLFQRLWTDEEELLILRGFLEFTSRRGTAFASHQYDTGPFYEEIRRKLSFDFSKNQLIEKLRRLKKKYRVCANRMAAQGGGFAFRSAHEGAIYDVARHIWRSAFKRDGVASDEDDINPAEAEAAAATTAAAVAAATASPGAVDEGGGSASAHTPRGRDSRRGRRRTAQEMEAPSVPITPALILVTGNIAHEPAAVAMENSVVPLISPPPPLSAAVAAPATANGSTEDDFRSILSPLLKELVSSVTVPGQTGLALGLGMGFGGASGADILGLGFGVTGLNPVVPSGEKWRQQQILELEVYLKRIELIREQVTSVLEELRSSEG